ncbi:tyrosine-type recombinase/integrase [Nocardiopsis sp. NPDC007018]|uniref:tyrosine-type recombinase/integrase n=1 Tax=Nocardiopsis sp. NPDC007018 TaxID=3155721 RepID=UPI0033DA6F33
MLHHRRAARSGARTPGLRQRTLLRFLRTVARDASGRDRAICHLTYYAGLRVAEIVALDVSDLRLSARKGSARVRGKDRTVPLHAQVRTTLEGLLDDLGRPRSGPLIQPRRRRSVHPGSR